MVKILPFRGFRYDIDKVDDFKLVVSPPYDVISSELQKKLHEASEFNITHLIKGKKFETDSRGNNEYLRAAKLLDTWIESGVLEREDKPSIYVLAQDFEVEGEKMTRAGFIALINLEEMCASSDSEGTCTGVHQHEETLPKDIEDRLNLLSAAKANFGLIFSIYSDERMTIDSVLENRMKTQPLMTVIDDDGVIHRLWAMDDENEISRIQEVMDKKYIIIADGHHRYKTALRYSKEHPDEGSSKFRMLAFVNTMNKGLVILPTHRLVQGVEGFDCEKLITALSEDFIMEEFEIKPGDDKNARDAMFSRIKDHFAEGKHAFGLYCNDGKYYSMVLKNENKMDAIENHSKAWKHLDVTILHKLILENMLGLTKEKVASGTIEGGSYVEYIKAIGDAVEKSVEKVNEKGYQAVFFMNPTKVGEVEEVATNHETMPQKSTFFYPKVYTGFVINKL
ncbi:MAG: DUF1015 domain-containing protein [Methanomassiliicoccales archaeon]|nr:MAG: DUF1015 domain-containing protein [Methanomassiliicoccales archaeon]